MSGLADRGLTQEGTNVVSQFAESMLWGDSRSYESWMDLSTNAPRGEEQALSPNGFSQALARKAEPEWQGESSEADAETAAGSREPENQSD